MHAGGAAAEQCFSQPPTVAEPRYGVGAQTRLTRRRRPISVTKGVSTTWKDAGFKLQFLVVSKAYNALCYRLGCSCSAAAAHLDVSCSARLQRKLSSPLIRDLGRRVAILSVKCLLRTWQTHTTRTQSPACRTLTHCCRRRRGILAGALRILLLILILILQCGESKRWPAPV